MEDLAKVPVDGVPAEEELGTDLGVGQAGGGQFGDVGFLGGEAVGGAVGADAVSCCTPF